MLGQLILSKLWSLFFPCLSLSEILEPLAGVGVLVHRQAVNIFPRSCLFGGRTMPPCASGASSGSLCQPCCSLEFVAIHNI